MTRVQCIMSENVLCLLAVLIHNSCILLFVCCKCAASSMAIVNVSLGPLRKNYSTSKSTSTPQQLICKCHAGALHTHTIVIQSRRNLTALCVKSLVGRATSRDLCYFPIQFIPATLAVSL